MKRCHRAVKIGFMACLLLQPLRLLAQETLVVYRFHNKSLYRGTWDIRKEMTDRVVTALRHTKQMEVIKAKKNYPSIYVMGPDITLKGAKKIVQYTHKRYQTHRVLLGHITHFSLTKSLAAYDDVLGVSQHKAKCSLTFMLLGKETLEAVEDPKWTPISSQRKKREYHFENLTDDYGVTEMIRMAQKHGMNSRYFDESPLGEAVIECVNKTVERVMVDLNFLNTTFSTIHAVGKIVDVASPNEVYINLGNEVKEGLVLVVYLRGDVINDKETGEVYGYREDEIALIKVQRILNKHLSKATVIKKYTSAPLTFGQHVKAYIPPTKQENSTPNNSTPSSTPLKGDEHDKTND